MSSGLLDLGGEVIKLQFNVSDLDVSHGIGLF